jgi:hypothetical protein
MPLILQSDGFRVGRVFLKWKELQSLRAKFLERNGRTLKLERDAATKCRVPVTAESTRWLVKEVCIWGGYAGIYGRVLANNPMPHIQACLSEALEILDGPESSPKRALETINRIKGLGTPSFASKHLRLLRPAHCVVFDSILRDESELPFNSVAYAQFCAFCTECASAISKLNSYPATERKGGVWLPADVEMGLFEQVSQGQYREAD